VVTLAYPPTELVGHDSEVLAGLAVYLWRHSQRRAFLSQLLLEQLANIGVFHVIGNRPAALRNVGESGLDVFALSLLAAVSATAVDGQRGTALLRPETVNAMLQTPLPRETGASGARNAAAAAGLCWGLGPDGDGVSWSHAGALVGSCDSWLIRRADGTTMSVLFNSRPREAGDFFGDLIPALTQAGDGIQTWPAFNLFRGS